MGDQIELTLPVSGKKAVIRNYTTYSDDYKAEQALKEGVFNENIVVDGEVKTVSKYPQINLTNFSRSYVESLVLSIDGDSSNVSSRLMELRTPDYKAIETAVDKICADQSPKLSTVSNDGSSDTVQK